MNIDNIIKMEGQTAPAIKRKPGKRFVRSLEYEVIANLAMNQFAKGDAIAFDKLLSIPLEERIPGLIENYGLRRAHRLIKMVLQEFCFSVPLPKSAKLSETKTAAVACDLILSAYEDQLSMEDLIVFFERAKEGKYGKFKTVLTHFVIMQKLDQYRKERADAYQKLLAEQQARIKKMSDVPRIGEPKAIGELFQQAEVIDLTRRKSG